MSEPLPEPRAARLTWPRVRELLDTQRAVALLPVGSTEAHGPHLPLDVDVLIAEAVCMRAAHALWRRGTPALVFPAVAYGLTDFAAAFAGTVGLSPDGCRALLTDALGALARQGFAATVAVNHHLEPAHFRLVHEAAREAARASGRRVLAADHRRPPFGPALGEEFMRGGSHAGTYETSLVLAIAPERVDEDRRRALPALEVDLPGRIKAGARTFAEAGGPEAYFGAPARASAAEGERLLGLLVDCTLAALDAP